MKSELGTLKEGQAIMQKELAELRTLRPPRQVQPTFQPVDLNTKGAPYLGDRNAPVTMVEFTDYQCPYCRRHAINTLPLLLKNYVETGKLLYVVREVPVESNHPLAGKAAEAALCAGDQDRYWEMHDKLFENQAGLQAGDLRSYAQALGLNATQFDQCLEGGNKKGLVQKDVQAGKQAGMRGTPTFFLGLTPSGGGDRFRASEVIRGARTYPDFAELIDELLARAGKEKAAEAAANSAGQ